MNWVLARFNVSAWCSARRVVVAVFQHGIERVPQTAHLGRDPAREGWHGDEFIAGEHGFRRRGDAAHRPRQPQRQQIAEKRGQSERHSGDDDREMVDLVGAVPQLLQRLRHHHAPPGFRHDGVPGDHRAVERRRKELPDPGFAAHHGLDRRHAGQIARRGDPVLQRVGDHLALGVRDHRVPAVAERDGLLQRHQIPRGDDAKPEPSVGQPLHQIKNRFVVIVVIQVGERGLIRCLRRQGAQCRQIRFAGWMPDLPRHAWHHRLDRAIGTEDADMGDVQRFQQRREACVAGGRDQRPVREGDREDRLQVLDITRHRRRQIAGHEQMPFPHRVEFILIGHPALPQREDTERRRGNQRERQKQQMVHPRPLAHRAGAQKAGAWRFG